MLNWLESHRVVLKAVIFDGAFEKKKSQTRVSRRSSRASTMEYIYSISKNLEGEPEEVTRSFAADINGLSDPVSISGFREILIACLRSKGIEIIVAEGEADNLIALTSQAIAGSAVLSEDSDFFIFGVPLATLSSMSYPAHYPPRYKTSSNQFDANKGEREEQESMFRIHLFTPQRVLQCLKIAPQLLPHLSILCGNDFSDRNLAQKFSVIAKFASRHPNAPTRVGLVLQWLKRVENIDNELRKAFKRQKAEFAFDNALREAKHVYSLNQLLTPDEASNTDCIVTAIRNKIKSPFEISSEHHKVEERMWRLHANGDVPPLVIGMLKERKYWNPIVVEPKERGGSGTIESKLFPLRCAFYRSLFSSTMVNELEETLVISFTEVGRVHDTTYELEIDRKENFRLFDASGSVDDLMGFFDMHSSIIGVLKDIPRGERTEHKLLLMAMCFLKKIDLLPEPLVEPLLSQFALLRTPSWVERLPSMAPLPSPQVMVTSSAISIAISWAKLLNTLLDFPLGNHDNMSPVFDGFVLAAMDGEESRKMEVLLKSEDLAFLRQEWSKLASIKEN